MVYVLFLAFKLNGTNLLHSYNVAGVFDSHEKCLEAIRQGVGSHDWDVDGFVVEGRELNFAGVGSLTEYYEYLASEFQNQN